MGPSPSCSASLPTYYRMVSSRWAQLWVRWTSISGEWESISVLWELISTLRGGRRALPHPISAHMLPNIASQSTSSYPPHTTLAERSPDRTPHRLASPNSRTAWSGTSQPQNHDPPKDCCIVQICAGPIIVSGNRFPCVPMHWTTQMCARNLKPSRGTGKSKTWTLKPLSV